MLLDEAILTSLRVGDQYTCSEAIDDGQPPPSGMEAETPGSNDNDLMLMAR
jgi:hypothetical protein